MRALLPCIALLLAPPTALAQDALTLELLAPAPPPVRTTRDFVNVLGRTTPGAQVRVGGEAVTVHATGVFVRDRVPLQPGSNTIRIEATAASGQTLTRQLEVERQAPPPAVAWPRERLFVDGASLRPAELQRLAPGEALEVAARATPGHRVQARLAGQPWMALAESSLAPGRYRAWLGFDGTDGDVAPAPVQVRIVAAGKPRRGRPHDITVLTPGPVGQWRADPARLFITGSEGAELLHGLHEVRLGGPFLAELPAGTLLAATGQRGEHLRVQLAPDTWAWVAAASVRPAPAGTRLPAVAMTTLSVEGGAEGDVVQIPLPAGVPYAVRAVADAGGRQQLELEIFGAHHATTWITHHASARVVRELVAEQAGPQRVRLRFTLHEARLWGWREERTEGALRIVLRAPPVLAREGSPLAGLRVALEPGHGGADNLGAVGATGVPEKDINRWTVAALKAELEAAGAQVVVVREGDDAPELRERVRRATAADAQLFVSVHANAGDTSQGYLRHAGTASFYKHAPSRDLAAAVHKRVLEHTGLDDLGLVGNFNYAPIRRQTWMPAVLVEQAFVSHPGEEARLLDPAFRALIARAVRLGLEDFLRQR
jgi:N-acetylmuramoyl-L-alanine amidase